MRSQSERFDEIEKRYSAVEARDSDLLGSYEREFAVGTRKAGRWLKCAPGCTECCTGPKPITQLDALRMQVGLVRLARDYPDEARDVQKRAERAWKIQKQSFPGDPETGILSSDDDRIAVYESRFGLTNCPSLNPATGLCELYEYRPLDCRSYGLPYRFDGESGDPCRLCFRGADEQVIELCRIEPDPENLEEGLLDEVESEVGAETLISYALATVPLD
ncbi:MAG: YkgJ family cysteine cluster protein [Acidobacteriota bacterium]|nr:MAG: YkgJ family cysteine cluster protein [Acidobacteriota bacterium]